MTTNPISGITPKMIPSPPIASPKWHWGGGILGLLVVVTLVLGLRTSETPLFWGLPLLSVGFSLAVWVYFAGQYQRLQEYQAALLATHNDLTQHYLTLAAQHRELEITHELTLYLHTTASQSVQQRLLKAVTKELGFGRAVMGLISPTQQRLEEWQAMPPLASPWPPLALTSANNVLTQAVLTQQARWYLPTTTQFTPPSTETVPFFDQLQTDLPEEEIEFLNGNGWLILPLVWQKQGVGVLLVSIDLTQTVNLADKRWAVLTSLVSQAAVSLGTVDRTRRLAIEEERNRIARDIHDTIAQSLFGVVFSLDACVKMLPEQVEVVQQELVDLRYIAQEMRHQVRQSILDIWPSDLTTERFKVDLNKYVATCSPDHVFTVDFTIEGDFEGLSAGIRRGLYRVCQEALANSARYAGVDTARVYLCVEAQEVSLSIRDKGRGFDPKLALARETNREKFGLRGMRERVEKLGGTCDILSQVGHGTQVLIRLPVRSSH